MEKITEAFEMLLGMDKELLQIIGVTLRMSFFSTLISCLAGMPLGIIMARGNFRGKRTIRNCASGSIAFILISSVSSPHSVVG